MAGKKFTLNIASGAAVTTEELHGSYATDDRVNIAFTADGWTTAELGVDLSWDGSTWFPFYSGSTYFGLTAVAAGVMYELKDIPLFPYMRLRSRNSGGADVNQGAARVLTAFITRSVPE